MLALFSYTLIGFGVGAAGTPLLALLASYSSKSQKGFAASITFLMMILGLAITGITAGIILDPYSHQKLIKITTSLAIITNILSYLSLKNLEKTLRNNADVFQCKIQYWNPSLEKSSASRSASLQNLMDSIRLGH